MPTALFLEVREVSGRLSAHWGRDGQPIGEASTPFDWESLRPLQQAIDQVISQSVQHDGRHRSDASALHLASSRFTAQVLPEGLRKFLAAAEPDSSLLLDVDGALADWPWELLLCEERPLCLRFVVARHCRAASVDRPPTGPIRVGIVANPQFNLPAATREGELVRRLLSSFDAPLRSGKQESSQSIVIEVYRAHRVTRDDLERILRQVDWLHFVGHGESSAEGVVWKLFDSDWSLATLSEPPVSANPRFIFSHACHSARHRGGISARLVKSFAAAGVQHFLGPTTIIPDAKSIQFAEHFYRALKTVPTIAAAVLQARRTMHQQSPNELAWASYLLFGDPEEPWSPSVVSHAETPPAKTSSEFPIPCASCGEPIRTRHGIGKPLNATPSGMASVLCRNCARRESS